MAQQQQQPFTAWDQRVLVAFEASVAARGGIGHISQLEFNAFMNLKHRHFRHEVENISDCNENYRRIAAMVDEKGVWR